MSFLDQNGLAHFYSKIKEKFVRSINSITPDSNGNVAITNVETANNLTSPDGQTSYDTYIYRTSGGDVSLNSGEAELLYIEGNMQIKDRVDEVLTSTATNNIGVMIDVDTWRNSDYGAESDTYTFNYTANTQTWDPSLTSYGITASNVNPSSINISVSGNITEASVNKSTWETQITTTGIYYFQYLEENWTLNNSIVNLTTYGITITGEPKDSDIITVNYIAATPDSTITVTYVKKEQGTILVAKPTSFSATGFNQCDITSMILNNMAFSNNVIVEATGKYICYCKAVGGVTNGYVAYSQGGYIEDIGWCASVPQESVEVVTTNKNVTTTLASIPFDSDGYVVVVVSDPTGLCIHPKWSGTADEQYEDYVSPSIITFPTTGTLNGATVTLPLATYGMPSINSVADILDLEKKIYIKKIGQYPFSAGNLATVQSMGVPYDYDNTNIFYVLNTPITYAITINSTYIVNDFGTEEFIGTQVPVIAQTLYGQNLRDKLRLDVELKKLDFYNTIVAVSAFVSDSTYEDYPYRAAITLSGVNSNMIPNVIFGVAEATSGTFAPVSQAYNGGIYIYASDIPEASLSATIDVESFLTKVTGSGTMVFQYTTNGWNIDPTTYNIITNGSAVVGDTISVAYDTTEATAVMSVAGSITIPTILCWRRNVV